MSWKCVQVQGWYATQGCQPITTKKNGYPRMCPCVLRA